MLSASTRRPALLGDQVRDRQILAFERLLRVEHKDDGLGEAHGAQRVGDRQPFEPFLDPRPAAHPGGVDQPDRAPAPEPFDRDRVAGDARLGTGQHPLLADAAG